MPTVPLLGVLLSEVPKNQGFGIGFRMGHLPCEGLKAPAL